MLTVNYTCNILNVTHVISFNELIYKIYNVYYYIPVIYRYISKVIVQNYQ